MMIAHVLKADRRKKRRPGRLPPDNETRFHMFSSIVDAVRNRWRPESSSRDRTAPLGRVPSRHSSRFINSQVDNIEVVANVSVNESEPFYDQDRIIARGSSSRSLWASVRDAIGTSGGGPAAPVGSLASPGESLGYLDCGDIGIEMCTPVVGANNMEYCSTGDSAQFHNHDTQSSNSIWLSIREALSQALSSSAPAIANATPTSTLPGSRQNMSPASSATVSIVDELNDLAEMVDSPPSPGNYLPPKHRGPPRGQNMWGSIREALLGAGITETGPVASKHDVTPALSREASDFALDISGSGSGIALSASSSAGLNSRYPFTPNCQVAFSPPTPGSYDNSARISINSVDEDHINGQSSESIREVQKTNLGKHIFSSLMAIAAGGSGAVPSLDNSNYSTKCPSASSTDHHGVAIGTTTPAPLDYSDEGKLFAAIAAAAAAGHASGTGTSSRSSNNSLSLWSTLRESLAKTLNNSPRPSNAVSNETSAHSSKNHSVKEDFLGEFMFDLNGRPIIKTESSTYSGDGDPQQTHFTDRV